MHNKQREELSFQGISSMLSTLITEIGKRSLAPSQIKNEVADILNQFNSTFESAFKPAGHLNVDSSSILVKSSMFKQGSPERFTYMALSKLREQIALEPLSSVIEDNPNNQEALVQALIGLQNLVDFFDNINRGKVLSSGVFIKDIHQRLISINDAALLINLITDYGLGSSKSTVSDYIARNQNNLDSYKLEAIEALDSILRNAPTYGAPSHSV